MEQPRRCLFTTRSLILLVLPIMAEQLLAQFVGMVDGIMVSSVGEVAISAVSLVTNFSGVMINLLAALCSGGCIVTSQFIGAGKENQARRSAGQVITMAVLVSTALCTACLIFNRRLLALFFGSVDEAVLDDAVTYFIFDALSYPCLAICSAGGAIMRAKGNTKVTFYISILRNIVNIVGNAICIFGLKMGVAGVAIPTALSRVVGAAVILVIVMRKDQPLRPSVADIFHINRKLMGKMLRVGLPTAVENSLFQLGRLMTLSMISGFGTVQIAANSTANALVGLVVTLSTAMRLGAMTVIGQCVGAQDEKQIKDNHNKFIVMSYILYGIAAIALLLLRHQAVGLYTGLSPEAAKLATELICIHLIASIFLYTPSFQITSSLRASNDGTFSMLVSILSMAIFRLTLAQILCVNLGWGAKGVWYAMVVDWFCRSICFVWRWYGGGWKKKCGLAPAKSATKI